jgi:predicted PurR-regulated permease PerM
MTLRWWRPPGLLIPDISLAKPKPMQNMSRIVSLSVLLVIIIALGMTFFRVVAPFFLPLFLAAMTAIVCQPIHHYFLKRTGNREPWAAVLTTVAVLALGLIPTLVAVVVSSLQLYAFASALDRESVQPVLKKVVVQGAEFANRFLPAETQFDVSKVTQDATTWLRKSLTEISDRSLGNAAGTTFGVLKGAAGFMVKVIIGLMMYSIALYYFFADGAKLLQAGEAMVPVSLDHQRQMSREFAKVVRSVVVATFLAALAQGLATTAAIGLLGFKHLVPLFALATFAALIPLLGTWLVWMPCALWLFSHDQWGQGVFLVLYGICVVGLVDNVVRTYVLNSNTKLHPLLAFVSVLGGIEAMGLWGVFIGPIVACCLHALVKIFNVELKELSQEHFSKESVPLPGEREVVPGIPVENLSPKASEIAAASASASSDSKGGE